MKLHENERNWTEKGHVSLVPPPPSPDPLTKAVSKGEGTHHPNFLHFHAVFKKKEKKLKIEPSVPRSPTVYHKKDKEFATKVIATFPSTVKSVEYQSTSFLSSHRTSQVRLKR